MQAECAFEPFAQEAFPYCLNSSENPFPESAIGIPARSFLNSLEYASNPDWSPSDIHGQLAKRKHVAAESFQRLLRDFHLE